MTEKIEVKNNEEEAEAVEKRPKRMTPAEKKAWRRANRAKKVEPVEEVVEEVEEEEVEEEEVEEEEVEEEED